MDGKGQNELLMRVSISRSGDEVEELTFPGGKSPTKRDVATKFRSASHSARAKDRCNRGGRRPVGCRVTWR